jgi:HNH endonuclease
VRGWLLHQVRRTDKVGKLLRQSDDGCWLWLGGTNGRGYGMTASKYVHRMSWELMRGPIPEDLEIDHLCHARNCVNPDHMELVTHGENLRRRRS